MKDSVKRLTSWLLVLAMVCSLVVTPAEAAEAEWADLPVVTLDERYQTKYIYADSVYNDLDRMLELADPITCTYKGEPVELEPDWKMPERLIGGSQGSRDGYSGYNYFTANTFTVKGTTDKVRTASYSGATLAVMVIGLKATNKAFDSDEQTVSVKKSAILDLNVSDD